MPSWGEGGAQGVLLDVDGPREAARAVVEVVTENPAGGEQPEGIRRSDHFDVSGHQDGADGEAVLGGQTDEDRRGTGC